MEHIAPQQPDKTKEDWDWNIYDKGLETQNSFGNLTLLPQVENSSIGNASWKHKKVFYQALSSKTQSDMDNVLDAAEKLGVNLKSSTIELLSDSTYLPLLNSVCCYSEFTEERIKERSENITDLAWDNLWKYLN